MPLRLTPHVSFAELRLEYAPDTGFRYLPEPLGRFALYNGLDPEHELADDNRACNLIAAWYVEHREAGGVPDPAAEAALDHLRG